MKKTIDSRLKYSGMTDNDDTTKKIYCARGFYYHMVLPSSLAVYPLFAQIRKRTCDTEGIFILYWCQGFCLARISNIYVLNHP